MTARAGFWAILGGAALAGLAQDPVNQGARMQQEFTKRVDDYVNLRKTARQGWTN
jgi:hypothetical protein